MPPNPSIRYMTNSLRIAPPAEVGIAWNLAFESVNHKPGNSRQTQGLHERHFDPSMRLSFRFIREEN
jgi:hypothetical protein